MSKIIKESGYRELSHIVQTDDGKMYLVDSNYTEDCGYETMAFKWDDKKDAVVNYLDVYVEHYRTWYDMEHGHEWVCSHLEEVL